jgi:hypothetical protein
VRPFNKLLTSWADDHFRVELYECRPATGNPGQRDYLGYQFFDYAYEGGPPLLFIGDDYSPAPSIRHTTDAAVFGLLAFLSLQQGDTDAEYFSKYSPRQLAWRDSERCQDLKNLVTEFENSGDHG